MSRKFFQITFSILLLAGMLLGFAMKDGALANALQAPAAQGNPEAKFEAGLLDQLNASSTDFFVTMAEQADLSGAAHLQTKAEKGQYVFDVLVATADRTQVDLRSFLDSQSVEYKSFYIVNTILVKNGSIDLAQSIAARPDVASIYANHTYQLEQPIDPKASTAQPNYVEPNISFVNADQVWAMGYSGQGTVIAGNDTGLDETHPAIAPHYRGCLNPPTCTQWDHNYNWWDPTGTYPTDPYDGFGHGTHTTGTMVGDDGAGNQIGMAPGAQTIHCKLMDDGGYATDAWITECFEWDLAPWDLSGNNPDPSKAPDAVNNSWGWPGGGNNNNREATDALLAAGIVAEFSAGNEGSGCQTLRSPGDFQEVFTTGSVNHAYAFPGLLTGFSSRGPSVLDPGYFPDFMAPGENIRSSLPGNQYAYWGGTSMAGPHVTALIGLIWSANPSLKGQIQTTYDIIQQTVVPLTGQNGSNCGGNYVDGPNNDWGYGTIDALAAVNLAISYGGAGTLQGTVTDSVTGLPIASVTVHAVRQAGGAWTATTDASGFYQITVAAGTFDITASHSHFMTGTANGVVVDEDGTTVQNFSLTPRGWAEGYVYDYDNPTTGIPNATVTADDGSTTTTDGSGYYILWLDPGDYTLTADAPDYAPESAAVTIVSGQSTPQDFYLQAAVVFVPSPIEVSVPLGELYTEPATITNRLPTDYAFEFQERDLGYLPLAGGQVNVDVKASPAIAPANTAVAVSGYTARPASTVSIERHAGINQANVLLLAADDDNGGYSPIQQLLLAYGDLGAVDLYDARYATPTLAELQAYNVVVVWANYIFADATGIGNVLADYVDAGGKVIDLMFALDPNWGYQGRFRSESYTAMTVTGTSYMNSCLGTFDPSHPIMDGITDVCDLFRGAGTMLTAGSYEVARWQDNELFVAAKDDGSVVSINGYVGIAFQYTGQFPDVLHNAINFVAVPADVPWLSEDPAAGVVPADGSLPVNINFDASPAAGVTQPGNYSAELTIKGEPKVKVPVHMYVEAPESWGTIEGTVIGLGYCDQEQIPLEEAQVVITGSSDASWTLLTDDTGHWVIWLDSAENPLTIDVSFPEYFGQSASANIIPGETVTVDFDLSWDKPCLTETPPTMSVTLDMGASTTLPMTLTNTGAGDGEFVMSDLQNGYFPPMRQGFLLPAVRPSTPDTNPTSIGRAPNASTLIPAELGKAFAQLVGEPAYAVDVYPGYNLVTFANDDPGTWTVVAGVPNTQYFAGDFINGDFSKLYVIDYGTLSLYTVDTATGAATLIGPSTPYGGESWTGMTGSVDGTMYASSTNISRSTLYTVDLDTGAVTVVGEITNAPAIIDIAITPEGLMFGVDIVNNNLVQIDPATGAGSVIGYIGFDANYAQGMDYEETSGTLYLAAYSSQGELRIADPATGNTVLVGAFPGGAEVDSLAFATGGGTDAPWLSEEPITGTIPGTYNPLGAPARPVTFGEPAINPGLTAASPAPSLLAQPAASAHPEAVLWDQPLSSVNQNSYVDQDFTDYPAYSSFLADDFVNGETWDINTIFVPGGGWNGFTTLLNATSLTWQIYADNNGVPAGDPFSGGAVWSLTLAPTDPQVVITNGSNGYPSNATLSMTEPVTVPDGHWWLVFYPTMPFTSGQYGRQPADTTNGYWGQFINPGGGFGYGTAWQSWAAIRATQQDIAFRLEGTVVPASGNSQVIDVTFDAGQVTQPGTFTGEVKAKTNDPVNMTFTVDVTMTVNAPADWGQLAGTVTDLGYCDANPVPLADAEVCIEGGLCVETGVDGTYLLWLEAGEYNVTVTADGHTTVYDTVIILPNGQVTDTDFDLRWLQPCLSEEPPSLEVTLNLGETATEYLNLSNTGAAEGTFTVSDSDKGYLPKLAQKPPMPVGNPVTPAGASSNALIQPFKSRINANDMLLITTTDTTQSVELALNQLGYAYDIYYGSPWTSIDFSPYNTVLVAMDGGSAEVADIQKLRTDVLDEGKKLIFLGGTCYQPFAQGMNDYIVMNDVNNYCWIVTNPPQWTLVDPSHPLADGLPDSYNYTNMSAGYYQIRVNDPDVETVAVNGEGYPAFFRKTTDGSFIWYIDSVYSSYWTDPSDFAFLKQLISNSIEVSGGGDALWLAENPEAGTVAPDEGTQTITVTFDAGVVTQPGTYLADITIKTNDPVNKKFTVPATMNVNGPEDWGQLEGIVSSLGYCDMDPSFLKGASVEIVGFPPLTTDASGRYSIWLPEGTYTVTVTADGHVAAFATVVIVAQQISTQDFGLRSIQPCVSTDPTSFEVNLVEGYSQTVPLTLINTGAGDTPFKIAEKEGALRNVEAYQPPALSGIVSFGTEKAAEGSSKVTVVRPTYSVNGDVILDQAPNQSYGIFSDVSCDFCGQTQVLAENFMIDQSVAVGQVIFWTGYYPGDVPIDPDHITVIFHADSAGLPGLAIYTETDVEYVREQTGIFVSGVHEYRHTLTLASPVFLDPGNYWVELYNDTGWGTDDFFWETGNSDPIHGLDGNGFSFTAPGESWNFESGDLAIQLITADLDVPWLSEYPITGTVAAGSIFNIDVTFDTMTYTVGTTVTATLAVKTQDVEQPTINIPVVMHVVAPTAPVVSFTSDSPVMNGDPMIFTNTTTDPGVPPTEEYLWDFGDGITMTVTTTDPVTHVYDTYDTYMVTLTACNVAGCDTATEYVMVKPWTQYYPMISTP